MHKTFATAIVSVALMGAALPPGPDNQLTLTGLGPVHIGMTIPQAEAALGTRLKLVYLEEDHDANACGTGERADGKSPDVFYLVEDARIARIDVTRLDEGKPSDPPVRTAANIGIGSTEDEIKRAYGAAVKVEPHPYLEDTGHYMIVKSRDGKRAFIFETDHGKVVSFRAGVYPPVAYIEGCA